MNNSSSGNKDIGINPAPPSNYFGFGNMMFPAPPPLPSIPLPQMPIIPTQVTSVPLTPHNPSSPRSPRANLRTDRRMATGYESGIVREPTIPTLNRGNVQQEDTYMVRTPKPQPSPFHVTPAVTPLGLSPGEVPKGLSAPNTPTHMGGNMGRERLSHSESPLTLEEDNIKPALKPISTPHPFSPRKPKDPNVVLNSIRVRETPPAQPTVLNNPHLDAFVGTNTPTRSPVPLTPDTPNIPNTSNTPNPSNPSGAIPARSNTPAVLMVSHTPNIPNTPNTSNSTRTTPIVLVASNTPNIPNTPNTLNIPSSARSGTPYVNSNHTPSDLPRGLTPKSRTTPPGVPATPIKTPIGTPVDMNRRSHVVKTPAGTNIIIESSNSPYTSTPFTPSNPSGPPASPNPPPGYVYPPPPSYAYPPPGYVYPAPPPGYAYPSYQHVPPNYTYSAPPPGYAYSAPAPPPGYVYPPQPPQLQEKIAYLDGDILKKPGKPVPDYSQYPSDEQARRWGEVISLFGVIKRKHPELNVIIPDPEKETLSEAHARYNQVVENIYKNRFVSEKSFEYRMYLILFWVIIEIIMIYILKLPGGYTTLQLRMMKSYDVLLIQLGEDKWDESGGGKPKDPLMYMLFISVVTALIFGGVRFFAKGLSENAAIKITDVIYNTTLGDGIFGGPGGEGGSGEEGRGIGGLENVRGIDDVVKLFKQKMGGEGGGLNGIMSNVMNMFSGDGEEPSGPAFE